MGREAKGGKKKKKKKEQQKRKAQRTVVIFGLQRASGEFPAIERHQSGLREVIF